MTQEEFAGRIGISQNYLSMTERGRCGDLGFVTPSEESSRDSSRRVVTILRPIDFRSGNGNK